VNVINKKNNLLKNLTQVRLNFALAKRKDHFSKVEDFVNLIVQGFVSFTNAIIKAINFITGIFNAPAIPTITNPMGNRLGWIELSSDFTSVPKIFIGTLQSNGDWAIALNNQVDTSANALMNNFHLINLPLHGNQWLTYKNKTIPLCCSDYLILKDKNYITTVDNKKGKITRLLWNLHKETADIDYRIQQVYTNNLKELFITDGNN